MYCNGGFHLAYDAYVKSLQQQGFTGDQLRLHKTRFHEAYAYLWCSKWTADEARKRTLGEGEDHKGRDVHALSRERVNGIVTNIDDWYDLFDIKPTDNLYLAPEKRIVIW